MLKTRLRGLFTNPLKHIWQDYSHIIDDGHQRFNYESLCLNICCGVSFSSILRQMSCWIFGCFADFSRGNGRLNSKTFFASKTFSISKKPREPKIARAIVATCCSFFFFFLLQQFYIVAVHFFEYFTMCIEKRSISRMWAQ